MVGLSCLVWWGCGAHGPLEVVHSVKLSLPPHQHAQPLPKAAADTPAPAPVPLRLASYNVNYGMAGSEEVARAILNTRAQTVFLQETTVAWQRFFAKRLGEIYPYQRFAHDHDGYPAGGMAVLSKSPIEPVARLPSAVGWFDAWAIDVTHEQRKLRVLNVHLRPPLSDRAAPLSGFFSTRDDRQQEMKQHLKALSDRQPDVVLGDFNEATRGWAVRLLQSRGYERALAAHDAEGATWRWTYKGIPLAAQLDHILFDNDRLSCSYAEILNTGDSDHLPLVADFVLRHEHDTPKPE